MNFFFFFKIFSLVLICSAFEFQKESEECLSWLKNHLFKNTELHMKYEYNQSSYLVKFTNFSDLVYTGCNRTIFNTLTLELYAETKTLIKSNLNLIGVLDLFHFRGPINTLILQNIKGFNQYFNQKKRFCQQEYQLAKKCVCRHCFGRAGAKQKYVLAKKFRLLTLNKF